MGSLGCQETLLLPRPDTRGDHGCLAMSHRVFACPKGAGPSPPRGLSWKQLAEPRTWAQLCLLPSVQVKVPVSIKDPKRHACSAMLGRELLQVPEQGGEAQPRGTLTGSGLAVHTAFVPAGHLAGLPTPIPGQEGRMAPTG